MNPNWLWLIIPVSVLAGILITGLCTITKVSELTVENNKLRKRLGSDKYNQNIPVSKVDVV